MKNLEGQFADWVNTKPRDEEYDWCAICGCALFQFYSERGYPISHVGRSRWIDHDDQNHVVPATMGDAAAAHPHTFGSLADRLSQHKARFVGKEGGL